MGSFNILYHLGRYLIMLGDAFSKPESVYMYYKELTRQMNSIGVGSTTIVVLIAVFIGAVTSVQFAYQLDGTLVPLYYIGYIVRD
ncbi:MAG: ABC transporter permease, partial [Saprospiraceae bacterium]|nr:ABC transporter permease [Saprospiraceae bacterium]